MDLICWLEIESKLEDWFLDLVVVSLVLDSNVSPLLLGLESVRNLMIPILLEIVLLCQCMFSIPLGQVLQDVLFGCHVMDLS